jgi:small subunit ribosomal protein S16
MKKLGRRHRPFYRICAMDARTPRDGKAIEELGYYDPMVRDVDARAVLNRDRVDYWLSVGAKPTEKVAVLIKKYGTGGTHLEQQRAALERLKAARRQPMKGATVQPAVAGEASPTPSAAANAEPVEETGNG